MLNFKKSKKNSGQLFAPVAGTVITLDKVPDPIFSQKMMGDGVAFIPNSNIVFAPCDGTITAIAVTNHAIGLINKDGLEILIHVGLDTVNFQGKGFTIHITKNQKVKKGQPLVEFEREFFEQQQVSLITPMIITNSQNFHLRAHQINEIISSLDTPILTYTKK